MGRHTSLGLWTGQGREKAVAGLEILDAPGAILESIRSRPNTPRRTVLESDDLIAARDRVLKHIKDSYLKRLDAPLDSPKPLLNAWMEIEE